MGQSSPLGTTVLDDAFALMCQVAIQHQVLEVHADQFISLLTACVRVLHCFQVVDHYSRRADGLLCQLTDYVAEGKMTKVAAATIM